MLPLKPTLKILVLGLRNIALFSNNPNWPDFYQLAERKWDFITLDYHLSDSVKLPKTDPYHRRLRFTNTDW